MIDFHYQGVDIDYDSYRDCENHGCDDICRCGVIVDLTVESIDYAKIAEAFKTSKKPKGNKEVFAYCVERVIRHNLTVDNFQVEVEGGYYGEEIEGVYLDKDLEVDLENKVYALVGMESNKEMAELALLEEYGFLLEKLEGCNWELDKVDISDIKVASGGHYKRLDKNYVKQYKDWSGIVCLVDADNKIVDGYHRLKSKEGAKKKVKVLRAVQS